MIAKWFLIGEHDCIELFELYEVIIHESLHKNEGALSFYYNALTTYLETGKPYRIWHPEIYDQGAELAWGDWWEIEETFCPVCENE